MGAQGAVHPHDPWASAHGKLEALLGKPNVETHDAAMWGVLGGDDCWYLRVEQGADGTVSRVEGPTKLSKATAFFTWDRCLVAAGVQKVAAEDPNAPGPPASGLVTIPELRDGATRARSKWDKAKVSVRGLFLGASRPMIDSYEAVTISMTAQKGDLVNIIGCTLADRRAPAPKLQTNDPITVTGIVEVHEASEGKALVSLDSCTVP